MLAFADEERFHPLAVEAYLGCCDLFKRSRGVLPWVRRSSAVTECWDKRAGGAVDGDPADKGVRRARALGDFDVSHFLRFLDPQVRKAQRALKATGSGKTEPPPWAGFAIVLAALAAGSWWAFSSSRSGIGKTLLVVFGLFLVVALYGWLEQRLGSDRAGAIFLVLAAGVALGFVVWGWNGPGSWYRWPLQGLTAVLLFAVLRGWAGRSLSRRAENGLKRLSVTPILVAAVWLGSSALLGWKIALLLTFLVVVVLVLALSDDLVAAYMAVFSSLRRAASAQAAEAEKKLRQASAEGAYPYYGRVWREPEGPGVALQYFYFYAFNDWRGQGGLNSHEADWEWVVVRLRREGETYLPEDVVLSQHHSPSRQPWRSVKLAGGTHPVVWVAVGSHANYFKSERRPLPDLIGEPWLKRLLAWVFRSRKRSHESAERGATRFSSRRRCQGEEQSEDLTTSDDPNGRGLVIGAAAPAGAASDGKRGVWRPVILDGSQPWIDYRGLWGLRSLLRNESGPPGPKWEREEKLARGERRVGRIRGAWEDPLGAE